MRDRTWVNRILTGDKAAGERLVSENYQRIYALLRSLSCHREVAEDLTQQTFTKAWQALPSFRAEARLSTWLCRIAYHEYTHWRRDRREFAALESVANLADSKAVVGLETVIFSRALAQLSDDLRETFLLHYQHELEVKEIAIILEVPAGTIKSRLFTARNRLREILTAGEPVSDAGPTALPLPVTPAATAQPSFITLKEKSL
jgi:RNA polymerase sigma-70 factor (ECF subfamily)